MAKHSFSEQVKKPTARTKKVLAEVEVYTDNFLMRLAASPYTVGILFGIIVGALLVWAW